MYIYYILYYICIYTNTVPAGQTADGLSRCWTIAQLEESDDI